MSTRRYDMLKSIIRPDSRGLVLIRPDPDSLASALALCLIFHQNRAAADIALRDPIKRVENRTMVKLLRIPVLTFKEPMLAEYNRICAVDGQPNQFPELQLPTWDIIIDHHPIAPGYTYAFADIRPDMGATSSMMVEYLDAARIRLTERIATALCYGIITDTDHFQRSLSREDAVAFSRLFPNANHQLLRVIDANEIPKRYLAYFELAFMRLNEKNRRAVLHLGAADSADVAVIVADFLIRISGIHMVAVSCLTAEKLVIIFRSGGVRPDVGRIADIHFSDLGSAGGHRSAARAEIPLDRLPHDVKVYSFDSIERFIERRLARPGKPALVETGPKP
ncbi:MAG: DHH family phosphoesterase [bacterium]